MHIIERELSSHMVLVSLESEKERKPVASAAVSMGEKNPVAQWCRTRSNTQWQLWAAAVELAASKSGFPYFTD